MRHSACAGAVIILMLTFASSAPAQLRPLEPIPWSVFGTNNSIAGQVGASRLFDQRASLAGTSGVLSELGNFSLTWRTGRVALEAAGTAERVFRDRSRFSDPYPDVAPARDNRRHDAGDYRVSTSVRLTPTDYPFIGVIRFGTRLPTTTDSPGLDRNETDFFATAGGSGRHGAFFAQAESGFSINGTRNRFQQQGLLVYAARVGAMARGWTPSISVLGQINNHGPNAIRGLENLGEARVGIRYSRSIWLQIDGVRGYSTFSPSTGILITAGYTR